MRHMRHWPGGALSLVHLNVLAVLDVDGPLPMRGLAETLDVSQASATGIIDRMEQRGLVERRRADDDRRVVRVALTEEGRNLIAGLATERREHLAMMLDQLTDDELAGFLLGARALHCARDRFHRDLPTRTFPPQARRPAVDPDPAPLPASVHVARRLRDGAAAGPGHRQPVPPRAQRGHHQQRRRQGRHRLHPPHRRDHARRHLRADDRRRRSASTGAPGSPWDSGATSGRRSSARSRRSARWRSTTSARPP